MLKDKKEKKPIKIGTFFEAESKTRAGKEFCASMDMGGSRGGTGDPGSA